MKNTGGPSHGGQYALGAAFREGSHNGRRNSTPSTVVTNFRRVEGPQVVKPVDRATEYIILGCPDVNNC